MTFPALQEGFLRTKDANYKVRREKKSLRLIHESESIDYRIGDQEKCQRKLNTTKRGILFFFTRLL
jgi:hypothetical protein